MGLIFGRFFMNYAVLPGVRPRLEALFTSGFRFVAYFIALVYGTAKLLPEHHPYLDSRNIGRFGVRHVIGEAANHLVLEKKNIDQILLFITILFGLGLMVVQIMLLAMGFVIQPVAAALPIGFSGLFVTQEPTQDLAAMMMDLVFGVEGLFNSCVSLKDKPCHDMNRNPIDGGFGVAGVTAVATTPAGAIAPQISYTYESLGFPYPIHKALHIMFRTYNTGLLVVATFIALYFMVTVVAETAQSGTAFGKRFNKVWAPLRIVLAFGLLVPIGVGFNASQYIVLYAAKFGSGFANNGWVLFNETLVGETRNQVTGLLGDGQKLSSTPNVPEIGALLQFYYLARMCDHINTEPEEIGEEEDAGIENLVDMYLVKGPLPTGAPNFIRVASNLSYEDMIRFADGDKQITIRYGKQNATLYKTQRGSVFPVCGEVVMRLNNPYLPGSEDSTDPGSEVMQRYYWNLLKELWHDAFEGDFPLAPISNHGQNYPKHFVGRYLTSGNNADANALLPPAGYQSDYKQFFNEDINAAMLDPSRGADGRNLSGILGTDRGAIAEQQESGRFAIDPILREKGWAGAAIWYNKVAEMNGALTSAVLNVPLPTAYPDAMEYVQRKKNQQDNKVPFETRFEPKLAKGDPVPARGGENPQIYSAYWNAYKYWQEGNNVAGVHTAPTGNAIIDAINLLFGTEGLYNMRKNQDVHPLAQLVGIGRGLVEASVRNLTVAVVGGAAGGLGAFIDRFVGETTAVAARFLVTFGMVTLTAGFILFYIIPFLPFIYFFFAVGGWVKGIFEAMVGAPLWALAHIRIDGDGLPGQAAVSGYFLIFEIFLRPILIVFGLLASISTFSALVSVLNNTFDLVTSNLTGFDHRAAEEGITDANGEELPITIESARSAVDEFFFTIVYAILVYLMGMASFKLIDLVPNNILRWMGQSITTFNDEREDAAQQLVGKATVGAQQTSSALGKGLQGIASAGGSPRSG